jgi:L-aminopeptidase/D-esterase-like protein
MLTNDLLNLVPKLSTSKHSLVLPEGFNDIEVAQVEYSEGPVGVTYIHFVGGAKVFMDVRGGWPGYVNSLSTNDKQRIMGICVAGGSMLGLEATSGVIAEALKESGYKDWLGVNGSIIYSQNLCKNKIYPDKALGRFAYANRISKPTLYNGQAGAGSSASKGQGWAYREVGAIRILCLVVNNALGDVYKNDKRISIPAKGKELGKNTTITVLIINLELDNDELKQLAHQAHCSMGECIRPFNTFFDGDVFYACSTETLKKTKKITPNVLVNLFCTCSEVVKEAIHNSC